MNFGDRLADAVERKGSAICIGLDPRIEMLPPSLVIGLRPGAAGRARAFERFCQQVIEAVADEAVAVKPQVAFFEALGGYGVTALEEVCRYAREAGLLVIVDGKRGDIDTTAAAYAQAWLAGRDGNPRVGDALTVNPYMGEDSVAPFLAACKDGAGVFVLALTSNPGAADLQELPLADGRPVWERTAELIAEWGSASVGSRGVSAVGAVVGATRPDQVARARELMPAAPLLLPGVGAQGGSVDELRDLFAADPGSGLISASRSVIYAWRERGGDWQQSVRAAAAELRAAVHA